MNNNYVRAKKQLKLTTGDSLRIARELQELSQKQLSEMTKIAQGTISAIENNHINMGVERAKVFARVLKIHPSVLLFPDWEIEDAA